MIARSPAYVAPGCRIDKAADVPVDPSMRASPSTHIRVEARMEKARAVQRAAARFNVRFPSTSYEV